MAGAVPGIVTGNPLLALTGAATSPRGPSFKPLQAAAGGIGVSGALGGLGAAGQVAPQIGGALAGPPTPQIGGGLAGPPGAPGAPAPPAGLDFSKILGQVGKDFGTAIQTLTKPENLGKTAQLLSAIQDPSQLPTALSNIAALETQAKIKEREFGLKELELGLKARKSLSGNALQKEILRLQGQGAKLATSEDIKRLPPAAIITLGSGTAAVQLVRGAKTLTAESASKLAVIKQASRGAKSILKGIEKGIFSDQDFNAAAFPGTRRLGTKRQKLSGQLRLISEGLGRMLSGAAVPPNEIKAFTALFSIQPLDTVETIKFKMNRSIKIIKDVENFIRFGGTIEDGLLDETSATEIVNRELQKVSTQGNFLTVRDPISGEAVGRKRI